MPSIVYLIPYAGLFARSSLRAYYHRAYRRLSTGRMRAAVYKQVLHVRHISAGCSSPGRTTARITATSTTSRAARAHRFGRPYRDATHCAYLAALSFIICYGRTLSIGSPVLASGGRYPSAGAYSSTAAHDTITALQRLFDACCCGANTWNEHGRSARITNIMPTSRISSWNNANPYLFAKDAAACIDILQPGMSSGFQHLSARHRAFAVSTSLDFRRRCTRSA